jgi:hypothetical protein
MANVNKPFGFRPIGTVSGSPWGASVQEFALDTGHAAIAVGDLVEMTADGTLDILTAGATDSGVIGVCVGVVPAGPNYNTTTGKWGDNFLSSSSPTLAGTGAKSVALNTAGNILVATAPDLLMVAQEDGVSDPLALVDIGSNVDIVGGGPDATTGVSDMMIDSDSHGTTNTDPLRLIGLYQDPITLQGDVTGAGTTANWVVTFANHAYSGLAVGI